MPASADRNLLFGILALQMDFITRDGLVEGMNAWVLDKSKSLGEILVTRGAMTPDDLAMLEPLVARHVAGHGGDAQQSLAALSAVSDVLRHLGAVADADVNATVSMLSTLEPRPGGSPTRRDNGDGTRYRILRPHARGGLGEVYVAQDAELNREVALKEIQAGKDHPQNRARFLLEAEVTGGLEHPGIVPVYGLGHYPDGRPFYAMRFIKGDNLAEAIKRLHTPAGVNPAARPIGEPRGLPPRYDSLEFRRLLQRFIDVCQAVAYAHSRGVLHRDLKPGNIMLGKYGETLVVDWGLAKVAGRSLPEGPANAELTLRPASGSDLMPTEAGSAVGTPAYMSPEQAAGRLDDLGPASDVYSLGATLYHLLAGKPPNAGHDVMSVLARTHQGEFDPPSRLSPGIPKALEAVCVKAMALKPGERYPTAQGLVADVEAWLADEPVGALPEPVTLRARRWVRKHPGLVAGLAASLVVGVLGLTAGLYFVNAEKGRTELARQEEERQRQEAEQQTEIARRNEQEATDRQEETEAVLKFVEIRILAAATPNQLGRDVKLADAVRAALPEVAAGFTSQPLIEARLRVTLGIAFNILGKPEIAEQQFRRALDVRTDRLGPDHRDTLRSKHNLALSYGALGRHTEALALHEETLRLMKAKLEPDHPDTPAAMQSLAASYHDLGRHPEALALRQEALRLRSARLGPDHPDTLGSMSGLAVSYNAMGRHREALALREEALRLRKARLGPDHTDTLASMTGLANGYDALGRHRESLALREEALRLTKAKFGPDHPETLGSMSNLVISYHDLGRHPEALALGEEALRLRKAKHGHDHPDTLTSMGNLAVSYEALGRHPEALALREEALRLTKAKLGPDHPDTLNLHWGVIGSLVALQRAGEVLPKIDELLALAAAAAAADKTPHPGLVPAMYTFRIGIYRDRKNTTGCRTTAETWEKLGRTDSNSLYEAACFRAVCAAVMRETKEPDGDQQADRAMSWLTEAVAGGYADVGHMKKNKDLDALRGRDDFKKLLAELEAKAGEKKKD